MESDNGHLFLLSPCKHLGTSFVRVGAPHAGIVENDLGLILTASVYITLCAGRTCKAEVLL